MSVKVGTMQPTDCQKDAELSKYLSLILRHKPQIVGITLDGHGWANVDGLLIGLNKTEHCDMARLERIVEEDEKRRYSFNDDKTLIRANQGHSIPVDLELAELTPPPFLYHGTGEKFVAQIDKQGLIPKSRLYVHLSTDFETAQKVGVRHGTPVVYVVESGAMNDKGFSFYRSTNGVWLTKNVPIAFLKKCESSDDARADCAASY